MRGIYKITSPIGKVYVGQSKNIYKRFSGHKKNKRSLLYESIKKYGFENHKLESLEEIIEGCMNARERYWQEYYDVIGENGLNRFLNETDELKRVLSKETEEIMRLMNKGRIHSAEVNLTKGKKRELHIKARIVLNIENGIFYDCIKDASEYLCINYSTLRSNLNGSNNKNNSSIIYADNESYEKWKKDKKHKVSLINK